MVRLAMLPGYHQKRYCWVLDGRRKELKPPKRNGGTGIKNRLMGMILTISFG